MQTVEHTFPNSFAHFEHSVCARSGMVPAHEEGMSLAKKHTNLLSLLMEWLEDERHSVWLGPALADESDEVIGIALSLEIKDEKQFIIYITHEELRETYPEHPSLDTFASLVYDDKYLDGWCIEINDKQFKAALGFDTDELMDYELHAPLLSGQQALRYALSYALSGTGDATIGKVAKSRYKDMELSGTPLQDVQLYHVFLSYEWKEAVDGILPACANYLYFR